MEENGKLTAAELLDKYGTNTEAWPFAEWDRGESGRTCPSMPPAHKPSSAVPLAVDPWESLPAIWPSDREEYDDTEPHGTDRAEHGRVYELTAYADHRLGELADVIQWASGYVNAVARGKGWYDRGQRNNGEMIALAHSELSEALEALRKGDPPSEKIQGGLVSHACEELADVIVRVLDIAAANRWPIGYALMEKIKYNLTRPRMHGGKLF